MYYRLCGWELGDWRRKARDVEVNGLETMLSMESGLEIVLSTKCLLNCLLFKSAFENKTTK